MMAKLVITIIALFFCLVIGVFGKKTGRDFLSSFAGSILLSPIFMGILLLFPQDETESN